MKFQGMERLLFELEVLDEMRHAGSPGANLAVIKSQERRITHLAEIVRERILRVAFVTLRIIREERVQVLHG